MQSLSYTNVSKVHFVLDGYITDFKNHTMTQGIQELISYTSLNSDGIVNPQITKVS